MNIQLNAMMYDHEETFSGSVRCGLSGVLGQLNKSRGAEASARYIAEGAWDPDIRCQPFYQRYLSRLFGPAVLPPLLRAYLLLEENEKALGWHGRRGLFGTYHHGNRMGVELRRVDCRAKRPKIDRLQLEKAVKAAQVEADFWSGRAAHCRQALDLLREARPQVLPGSRDELDYVIYKTENFITVFEELVAAHQAKAAFAQRYLAEVIPCRKLLGQ